MPCSTVLHASLLCCILSKYRIELYCVTFSFTVLNISPPAHSIRELSDKIPSGAAGGVLDSLSALQVSQARSGRREAGAGQQQGARESGKGKLAVLVEDSHKCPPQALQGLLACLWYTLDPPPHPMPVAVTIRLPLMLPSCTDS